MANKLIRDLRAYLADGHSLSINNYTHPTVKKLFEDWQAASLIEKQDCFGGDDYYHLTDHGRDEFIHA